MCAVPGTNQDLTVKEPLSTSAPKSLHSKLSYPTAYHRYLCKQYRGAPGLAGATGRFGAKRTMQCHGPNSKHSHPSYLTVSKVIFSALISLGSSFRALTYFLPCVSL